MRDEAMERLLDYDRRRYWLENGWSIRFRARETDVTKARPHGIRYSFTLHDMDATRLLGFDNAHGIYRPTITGTGLGRPMSWSPTSSQMLTHCCATSSMLWKARAKPKVWRSISLMRT